MGVTLLLIIFKGWGKKKKEKENRERKTAHVTSTTCMNLISGTRESPLFEGCATSFFGRGVSPFQDGFTVHSHERLNSVTLSHASALLKAINSLLPAFSLKRKKGGTHTPQTNPNQICIIFFFPDWQISKIKRTELCLEQQPGPTLQTHKREHHTQRGGKKKKNNKKGKIKRQQIRPASKRFLTLYTSFSKKKKKKK